MGRLIWAVFFLISMFALNYVGLAFGWGLDVKSWGWLLFSWTVVIVLGVLNYFIVNDD
jgi:hypothetical protein